MSVLSQNHNMFDDHSVSETVIMGNRSLFAIKKKEMDDLYADYDDKNADRIGKLEMQFDEMNGWNAGVRTRGAMLSNLGIGAEHHYTMMSGQWKEENESTCVIGTGFIRKSGRVDYG